MHIGKHISQLDTPALLIDLDVMESNLQRMAEYTRAHNLRLRPHTKTHKIPALARRQMDLGAAGITVAKVGEAEVMTAANPHDILVAYPVIGPQKLQRLMSVADGRGVTVSLDSVEAAQQLSNAATRTIGVLAEIDVGLGRVGVQPGEQLLSLVRAISSMPRLSFEGIAFYPGHIKRMDESARAALVELGVLLTGIKRDLEAAGFPVKIISGGSTPTMYHSHEVAALNEIRPGTYIFNDANTVACGACELSACAASVLATVVSTAVKNQMIIDGGSKTFSSDRSMASSELSFGYVMEAPAAVFSKMNEEHGFVDIRAVDHTFSIGDRVRVIPNHVCVAMNLHEQVYGIRGEKVESVWRVDARGKLQ
jgi:D-serine deaminase-like pyridoxal phosphate-dependent protein